MDNIKFINHPNEFSFEQKDCITIFGNGPSLKDIPKGYKFKGELIGMNRIDTFIQDHNLKLSLYIYITDNIMNKEWGNEWYSSLYNGFKISKSTIISNQVYQFLLKDNRAESKEILSSDLYVVNCLKEPRLYMSNAIVEPKSYFTKTGTSINFASQIALLFNPKEINFYGVDLGWKTTSKEKQNDPNHYHSNYFARINSGYYENARMHHVHDVLAKIFKQRKIEIKNFSPRTIVECYDVYDLETKKLVKNKEINNKNIFERHTLTFIDETKNDLKRIIIKVLKVLKIK
jgi:hypothetical protein